MAQKKSSSPLLDQAIGKGKKQKQKDKGGGAKKYLRNRVKCAKYRSRVGKPHKVGNKRGKQHVKN